MQDIRRLMVLAYTVTSSDMWESIAVNSFLEALGDPHLALEIRKKGATTLEGAYRDALLMEGFFRASETIKFDGDSHARRKDQVRAVTQHRDDVRNIEQAEIKAWQNEVMRLQKDLQQQI